MSENAANKGAGKGDKPRSCHSKEFKENFQRINWSKKKIIIADQDKIYLYPEHLNELVRCLLNEKELEIEDYLVTDESTIGDFIATRKDLKRLTKLKKKYAFKELCLGDLLWKIAEKMQDSRPF